MLARLVPRPVSSRPIMSDHQSQPQSVTSLEPTFEFVPLGALTVFPVTADELEELKRGSPASMFFNFAIFSFSTAISFSVSLATTKIESTKIFCVFVIVTVVGYLASAVLCALWFSHRRSAGSVIERIESRRQEPKGKPASDNSNESAN